MIRVKQRLNNPKTTKALLNGSITGSLTPWVNYGVGPRWAYDANDAKLTFVGGDVSAARLRQPFRTSNGMQYSYSFTLIISTVLAASTITMRLIKDDGSAQQTIRNVAPVNGTNIYSGNVTANNDYDWIEVSVTENIP